MKHLKKFNESKTPLLFTKQDMKDVFQDIIDDYDFYEFGTRESPTDGFNYQISKYNMGAGGVGGKISIYFIYAKNGRYAFSPIIKDIDFTPHINKLEKMGYKVDSNIDNYMEESTIRRNKDYYVKIVVSNPVEEYIPGNRTQREHGLHSVRHIEEDITTDDFKYHKEIIKEVFQDIIDKYDLYEYREDDNHGYIYLINYNSFLVDPNKTHFIEVLQASDFYRSEDKDDDRGGIRLEVSCTNGVTPDHIIDFRSQDFIDFEKRLKSMGYSVSKMIRLDFNNIEWIVFYIFP